MRVLQKDWLLDAAALDLLLTALHPEREVAAARFEEIRAKLIRSFALHGSLTPEENADDVFNRVARKLVDGAELDLLTTDHYFLSVARFVRKEYFRDNRGKFVPIDEQTDSVKGSDDAVEEEIKMADQIEQELKFEAFRHCRGQLSSQDLVIINEYCAATGREKIDRRNALAATLQKTKNALAVEVTRIRKRLRECARDKLREAGIIGPL